MQYASFQCMLVHVNECGSTRSADNVTAAVVNRPPTSSRSQFYDDMSDIFVRIGDDIDTDRFVVCGDFNCSGTDSTSIRAKLTTLFDLHGLKHTFPRQLAPLLQLPVYSISSTTALIPVAFPRLLYYRRMACRTMTWSRGLSPLVRGALDRCRATVSATWRTSTGSSSDPTCTVAGLPPRYFHLEPLRCTEEVDEKVVHALLSVKWWLTYFLECVFDVYFFIRKCPCDFYVNLFAFAIVLLLYFIFNNYERFKN